MSIPSVPPRSIEGGEGAERYRLADAEYVVIDVETTGLDPRIDALVEVAAIRFVRGRPVHTFATAVNPGRPIPAFAAWR